MQSLSLRELYECWYQSHLPRIPEEMTEGLVHSLGQSFVLDNIFYDNAVTVTIEKDSVRFVSEEDFASFLANKSDHLMTRKSFVKYMSCIEIKEDSTLRAYQHILCLLPEKIEVSSTLGSGSSAIVYRIKMNGQEYAMKTCSEEEFELTKLASSLDITPVIIDFWKCEERIVLISEIMDGSIYGSNPPLFEIRHMIVEIYKLIEKCAELNLSHGDLHLGNILYKNTGSSYIYKLIDFGRAEISNHPIDVRLIFKILLFTLGFGADSMSRIQGPKRYTRSELFVKQPYVTFAQKREALLAVKDVGMESVYQNFDEFLAYVTPTPGVREMARLRLDEAISEGLVFFDSILNYGVILPEFEGLDPELYYSNPRINARLTAISNYFGEKAVHYCSSYNPENGWVTLVSTGTARPFTVVKDSSPMAKDRAVIIPGSEGLVCLK